MRGLYEAGILENVPDLADERCLEKRNDPMVRDFSCDGAGHDLLKTRDHIDDDRAHIDAYRAVALAEGFEEGTPEEVLAAWQWLADHPEVTSGLQGWFQRRLNELVAEGYVTM